MRGGASGSAELAHRTGTDPSLLGDPAHRPGRHRRHAPTPAAGLPVRLRLRSLDELSALAVRAGLRVRRCDDIGWDHRLWVLERSAGQ
ncbi:hypothetical protein ACFV6B_17115 [Streptomyces microflavus]|uniref:hypothetical protein n=1 Tax=Streptomyces microflavus TaxID=1919 RepID=UPI0036560F05